MAKIWIAHEYPIAGLTLKRKRACGNLPGYRHCEERSNLSPSLVVLQKVKDCFRSYATSQWRFAKVSDMRKTDSVDAGLDRSETLQVTVIARNEAIFHQTNCRRSSKARATAWPVTRQDPPTNFSHCRNLPSVRQVPTTAKKLPIGQIQPEE